MTTSTNTGRPKRSPRQLTGVGRLLRRMTRKKTVMVTAT